MNSIRRLGAVAATFISGVVAFLLTGSQALAMNVAPPGGGPISPTARVVHQGTSGWELAFIALAALVFLAVSATLIHFRVLGPRRPATV